MISPVLGQRRPRKLAVLSTGGTIASRLDAHAAWTAHDNSDMLLADLSGHLAQLGLTVQTRDVRCLGSYLLGLGDMAAIVAAVRTALLDPDVIGVVITHGTDTMEETAFLADLVHQDARPVVFTGAQRGAGTADGDGPGNLADALTVAASPQARNLGALIVFSGQILPAFGTRKTHTVDTAAFTSTDSSPVGRVRGGEVVLNTRRPRPPVLKWDEAAMSAVRVDVVAYYPGADTTALRAVADAGADGIVLEATGAGNANPAFCAEIARLTANDVLVGLTTRVTAGPVAALYGAGGGVDLVTAGAIPAGTLRAGQARILLAALLAGQTDPAHAGAEFRRRTSVGMVSPPPSAPAKSSGLPPARARTAADVPSIGQ